MESPVPPEESSRKQSWYAEAKVVWHGKIKPRVWPSLRFAIGTLILVWIAWQQLELNRIQAINEFATQQNDLLFEMEILSDSVDAIRGEQSTYPTVERQNQLAQLRRGLERLHSDLVVNEQGLAELQGRGPREMPRDFTAPASPKGLWIMPAEDAAAMNPFLRSMYAQVQRRAGDVEISYQIEPTADSGVYALIVRLAEAGKADTVLVYREYDVDAWWKGRSRFDDVTGKVYGAVQRLEAAEQGDSDRDTTAN